LRHLLGTESLTAEQIRFLLDEAKPFQEFQRHPLKKLATLRGKTVALAFFEASTRTRISFATSAARLGADTMNLQAETSSLKKGESLLDTVRTLDAMRPDCIAMRHSSSGAAAFVASHLDIPVINAGDGMHEHPTQALLDALTIRDRLGKLDGLNITIIGDILHSRVARSNLHLLAKFGCRFTLCGPAMWLPKEFDCLYPGVSVRRSSRIDEALEGADAMIVLRVQQERLHEPALPLDEYILLYQLTPERQRWFM
jgi:aspartate carbamoyltransferase catalytic subunit